MLKRKALLDTSDELIVQSVNNGIKLIRPEQIKKLSGIKPAFRMLNLMQLPLNVGFLNTQSEAQNINDITAISAGLCTKKDAIGNTIHAVAKKQCADYACAHDNEVLKARKMIILEENYTRLSDEQDFQTITIKTPWYSEENKLNGVFFCTITLGLPGAYPLKDSLALILKLNLFSGMQSLSITPNVLPGTGIYIDDIYLSRMQSQCLYHLVRGKKIKMIAKALKLSPRTVEHYINNVKSKLGVISKTELIEKSIDYF